MDTLGMKLKLARVRCKLNQTEAVEKLKMYDIEITQSYLSKIENDVNEPDIKQIKAFAKLYNVDPMEFIFTEDEINEIKERYQNTQ